MPSRVVQNDGKCLKDEMVTMAHAHKRAQPWNSVARATVVSAVWPADAD